ncbi:hypothetical protein CTAYLR_002099 [Chrysophaeum taylorii]|uniref:Uncharacterized protein n=1 Tax=Chrysophaeum taylorii TaxID=2483200 RepID=A0AAD7UMY5_9STRA|nr:hypothetical protein CTAYLR_002099 [Chrysophaeum taylorii]
METNNGSNNGATSIEAGNILKNADRDPEKFEKARASRSITWQEDGLVEVCFKEELHYSLHSRDREIVRRQQMRAGCLDVDEPSDVRRCCAVS